MYMCMYVVKISGTIRFLDLKNIKIVILSAVVQKLWSNTSFCIMMDNITHSYYTLHVQTTQNIF